jgi:hypothetical protein
MGSKNKAATRDGPVLHKYCHLPGITGKVVKQAGNDTIASQSGGDRTDKSAKDEREAGGQVESQSWPDEPLGPVVRGKQALHGRWIGAFLRGTAEKQRCDQYTPNQNGNVAH